MIVRARTVMLVILCVTLALATLPAQAATTSFTARPGHTQGWHGSDLSGPTSGRWMTAPGTLALGKGSAKLMAGDAIELDPPPLDLSDFVAFYSTYGSAPATMILKISNGAILVATTPTPSMGWLSVDAASGSWQWDCGPDGGFEGSGTLFEYLATGCEDSEVVAVILASLSGTTYVDEVQLGTTETATRFDLEPPTLSIANIKGIEGDHGTRTMTFRVRLSGRNQAPVRISYATVNGTARAGVDYKAKHGTLTIPAGSLSGAIAVSIIGDRRGEANERFTLKLSAPSNATFADHVATGTIIDED